MDNTESTGQNKAIENKSPNAQSSTRPPSQLPRKSLASDLEEMVRFFKGTGGSFLYCLSAVFVAFGIVKVLGPVLEGSENLKDAASSLITLHLYELALLAVMIIIVMRKVIDDAVALVIIMILFLVGTSMAQGTVAKSSIETSLLIALAGCVLAGGKFYVMKRIAKVSFSVLPFLGVLLLMACNYLGPVILAKSIVTSPAQEHSRRELWLVVYLGMLAAGWLVVYSAMRRSVNQKTQQPAPFLQQPVMVYILTFTLLAASAVHHYSMAYTFALIRVAGDYIMFVIIGVLLLLEIFRHLDLLRHEPVKYVLMFIPAGVIAAAIAVKSVGDCEDIGLGLMCYPPMQYALAGLGFAAWAIYHKYYRTLVYLFIYVVGIVLTAGYSADYPKDLNWYWALSVLVGWLFTCGILMKNHYFCIAGISALCVGLGLSNDFMVFVENYDISSMGFLAGLSGLGCIVLVLIFGEKIEKIIRYLGLVLLGLFILDYMPDQFHWKYIVALLLICGISTALWFRIRMISSVLILSVPYFIKVYIASRVLASWRFIIVGFLLLVGGAVASIMKRPHKDKAEE